MSVSGTLNLMGDAAINVMSQGVQTNEEFDSNAILSVGGTLRHIF